MYELRCPHCDTTIELLLQKDLEEQYGLTPNKVVRLLEKDSLPEPVLDLTNRRLWTRQQIEEFRSREGQQHVEVLLHDIGDTLSVLPEDQREAVLSALLAQAKEHDGAVRQGK